MFPFIFLFFLDMSYFKSIVRTWIKNHFGVYPVIRTSGHPKVSYEECVVAIFLPNESENQQFREAFRLKYEDIFKDRPNFVSNITIDEDVDTNQPLQAVRCSIDTGHLIKNLVSVCRDESSLDKMTESVIPESKKTIIEYSSPNIAKPFHYGHLRSTILGNALSNLYSCLHQDVIRINYFGDWGTQFGMLSLGLDKYGTSKEPDKDACEFLLEVYVKMNQEAENDIDIRDEAKKRFTSLENGSDARIIDQWKILKEDSLRHYLQVYDRLGVKFDHLHWESMYSQSCKGDLLDTLRRQGILHESKDGALFVRVEDPREESNDSPEKKTVYRSRNKPSSKEEGGESSSEIIDPSLIPFIKRDRSSLYLSRDIAAALHRKSSLPFDSMLYIVESGQHKHFSDLKKILKAMGLEWFSQLNHVKFGRIHGMSSRRGSVILLQDVLNEAKERALQTLKVTKTTKIPVELFEDTADILGISGIIINDMRGKRTQDYSFEWNKVLRQTGDTGIALQYCHARLCSLEGNSGISQDEVKSFLDHQDNPFDVEHIRNCKEAMTLLVCLSRFDDALLSSYESLDPVFITRYLFLLKETVSKALMVCSVKQETDRRKSLTHLCLFSSSRVILSKGLQVLGLKPLKEM